MLATLQLYSTVKHRLHQSDLLPICERTSRTIIERQLDGVTLGCRTHDREIVGSTPGRVAIKWLLVGRELLESMLLRRSVVSF